MKIIILIILVILTIYYFNKSKFGKVEETKKIENIKKKIKKKVALILHVGNIGVFKTIINDYPRFFDGNLDLYFTCNNKEINDTIKQNFPNSVVILSENRGMDIGPFLLMIDYLIKNKADYNYYIKIHTKSDRLWRDQMINPIYKKLNYFLNKERSNKIEMYGAAERLYNGNFSFNYKYVVEILKRNYPEYMEKFLSYCKDDFDIKCTTRPYFIGGTIFVFNDKYFDLFKQIKNFNYEYDIMETGYITNDISHPRKTHAWEYLFGYFNYLNNEKIITI